MKKIIGIFLLVVFLAFFLTIYFYPIEKETKVENETKNLTETTQPTENITNATTGEVFTPLPEKETPEKNEIFIFSNRFEPNTLEIKLGEEVKFTNKDEKEHVIEFSNPPLTKHILPGTDFSFTFPSKGTVTITDSLGFSCSITIS
jgi:plastocyanin